MIKQSEKDLQVILGYAGLSKLPKAFDAEKSKKVWIDAILEVRKCDCTVSYAYAYNVFGKSPRIIKLAGTSAAIREIVSVHPINYLTKEFLPDLSTKEEIIDYLTSVYNVPKEKVQMCDGDELKTLLYTSCIEKQIMSIKQEKEYGRKQ